MWGGAALHRLVAQGPLWWDPPGDHQASSSIRALVTRSRPVVAVVTQDWTMELQTLLQAFFGVPCRGYSSFIKVFPKDVNTMVVVKPLETLKMAKAPIWLHRWRERLCLLNPTTPLRALADLALLVLTALFRFLNFDPCPVACLLNPDYGVPFMCPWCLKKIRVVVPNSYCYALEQHFGQLGDWWAGVNEPSAAWFRSRSLLLLPATRTRRIGCERSKPSKNQLQITARSHSKVSGLSVDSPPLVSSQVRYKLEKCITREGSNDKQGSALSDGSRIPQISEQVMLNFLAARRTRIGYCEQLAKSAGATWEDIAKGVEAPPKKIKPPRLTFHRLFPLRRIDKRHTMVDFTPRFPSSSSSSSHDVLKSASLRARPASFPPIRPRRHLSEHQKVHALFTGSPVLGHTPDTVMPRQEFKVTVRARVTQCRKRLKSKLREYDAVFNMEMNAIARKIKEAEKPVVKDGSRQADAHAPISQVAAIPDLGGAAAMQPRSTEMTVENRNPKDATKVRKPDRNDATLVTPDDAGRTTLGFLNYGTTEPGNEHALDGAATSLTTHDSDENQVTNRTTKTVRTATTSKSEDSGHRKQLAGRGTVDEFL